MKEFWTGEVPGNSAGNLAGKVVWRDGAMTTAPLFDRLALDLTARSRGPTGPAALARFAAAGIDTGGFASPLAFALGCHDHLRGPWARTTVAGLATLVPDDHLATLVLLLALRPALLRLVRRLLRRGVDGDDAAALVVGEALDVLAAGDLATHADVARWIVADTWRRCWNQTRRDGRFGQRWVEETAAEITFREAVAVEPEPTVDAVLVRAMRAGVLRPHHARLLYETRGLGRPLVEVAAEWGVDAGTLTSMRRRAEIRLRAMLETEAANEAAESGGADGVRRVRSCQ